MNARAEPRGEPDRTCASCGEERVGAYCSRCGQKALPDRHTLRGLLHAALQRTVNLEEGLTHTAYGLTVHPGRVVGDFWRGRTVRYTHPVPYFMLAVALFALVFRLLSGPTGAAESDRLIVILAVPFIAAASRLILWRTGRNFAEHLIGLLYLSGHTLVVATVLQLGMPFLHDDHLTAYALAALALLLGYFLWAYGQAFFRRTWIGAVAGLIALVAGTAAWAAAVLALVTVLRS
jgi:hypothetical protein